MARTPSASDFTVSVEGVGTFTFGRRQMADEIAIQVEYARILDGVEPTDWLVTVGGWLSVFKVLTVRAPEGWDIAQMDPLDTDTYAKMNKVYQALRDKERSFRSGSQAGGQGPGQGAGADPGVLVSAEVRPDAA